MRISLFVLTFLMSFLASNAQEELTDLRYNPALQQTFLQRSAHSARIVERRPFLYKIDTLSLPFFDDFSTNRIKKYHASTTDKNISLKVIFGFTVNGEHPETLAVKYDTTYNVTKPINGGGYIYTPNPTLYVVRYDTFSGDTIAVDTAWTNVVTEFIESDGIITYDTLPPDHVYINSYDTLYVVADDASLWVTPADEPGRGGAYVNNHYVRSRITQGVATFDGTDAVGLPYDINATINNGPADTLESKPLRLNELMSDIYLTFFYKPTGLGNEPENEDSLVLEFFNVDEESWELAWSISIEDVSDTGWSDEVWVPVFGAKYQKPGFRFRFRNYASLYGSFDHWHIDYVRLDDDRLPTDSAINDIAFTYPIRSFTYPLQAMPYRHYLQAYQQAQNTTTQCRIRNLSPSQLFVDGLNFKVFDPFGTEVYGFTAIAPNIPENSETTFIFPLTQDSIYTDIGSGEAVFTTKASYVVSGFNEQPINDTIYSHYTLSNYYAYDDGTAEKAYAIKGAGVQLAYEFYSHIPDTLRAILFNFPMVEDDNAEDLSLELRVWADTTGDPIYINEFSHNPVYNTSNKFTRLQLEKPVPVNGKFYIGYRQLQEDKIYIGFDANTNVKEKIMYKIGERWFASTKNGALMMRPDFGTGDDISGIRDAHKRNDLDYELFPNPSDQYLNVKTPRPTPYRIFSATGKLCGTGIASRTKPINTSHLTNGIYIIVLNDPDSRKTTALKFVVDHD
ncbi:MAG: hypothetical protein Kow0075_04720 [Salibacteraceae bacterium]